MSKIFRQITKLQLEIPFDEIFQKGQEVLEVLIKILLIRFVGRDSYGEVAYALRSAHVEDSSDCVKRLLCELQSKNDVDLSWDELLIKGAISSAIDYTSSTLQFQLAVDLGRRQGLEQCATVYSRCSFDADDIMEMMRQRGTSLDLSTEGDRECTVLFLWNKKSTSILPPTTDQINR